MHEEFMSNATAIIDSVTGPTHLIRGGAILKVNRWDGETSKLQVSAVAQTDPHDALAYGEIVTSEFGTEFQRKIPLLCGDIYTRISLNTVWDKSKEGAVSETVQPFEYNYRLVTDKQTDAQTQSQSYRRYRAGISRRGWKSPTRQLHMLIDA